MMKAILSDFRIEKEYQALLRGGAGESIMPQRLEVKAELMVLLSGDEDVKELEYELLRWAEMLCGGMAGEDNNQ
jgi:hypothetical protein